ADLNLAQGRVDLLNHRADLVDTLHRSAQLEHAFADDADGDLTHRIDRVDVRSHVGIRISGGGSNFLSELILFGPVFLSLRDGSVLLCIEHLISQRGQLALEIADLSRKTCVRRVETRFFGGKPSTLLLKLGDFRSKS